ncbi:hypothetical protein D3C80_854000 [compost metagenome]
MFLCRAGRALVDQQIAHGHIGVAQIGAEQRLTEEIHELIAGRMAAEKLAALMPRTVERAVALFNVVHQRAEERRAQLNFVLLCGGFQLASVKVVAGVIALKHALNA